MCVCVSEMHGHPGRVDVLAPVTRLLEAEFLLSQDTSVFSLFLKKLNLFLIEGYLLYTIVCRFPPNITMKSSLKPFNWIAQDPPRLWRISCFTQKPPDLNVLVI